MKRTAAGHFTIAAIGALFVPCVIISIFAGCGSDDINGAIPDGQFPMLHQHPVWLGGDVIAFEDIGARDAGPGWWTVDESRVGIVVYNLLTNEHELTILNGIMPCADAIGSELAALQSIGGPVIVRSDSQYVVMPETRTWGARSDLALSRDGRHLAWRSFGSDAEIGVWFHDRLLGGNTYLGPGEYPTWAPHADRLVYRTRSEHDRACLVAYDLAHSTRDTFFVFAPYEGSTHMTHSPDGTEVAFFMISATAGNVGIWILDLESKHLRQLNQSWGMGLTWGSRGIVYSNGCGDVDDVGCGVLWLLDPVTGLSHSVTSRYQFVR